ncbi:winged helix-turn-helix domain-containing protein [Streptomyces sp. NPDC059897]|uniref:winged helix-turn-helix domain-containing protein n=1 Tax=Streptomyces sp. NPDC059897 TaxID=3346994 RepID=UPI0036520DCE
MDYEIDRTRIVWRQIAAVLAHRIATEEYPLGKRFPSVADVAAEFDVSTSTGQKALYQLRDAGLLRMEHGLGTFVDDGGPELAKAEPFGPLPKPSGGRTK